MKWVIDMLAYLISHYVGWYSAEEREGRGKNKAAHHHYQRYDHPN